MLVGCRRDKNEGGYYQVSQLHSDRKIPILPLKSHGEKSSASTGPACNGT